MDKIKPQIIELIDRGSLSKIIDKYKEGGYSLLDLYDSQAEELSELMCIGTGNDLNSVLLSFKKDCSAVLAVYPWRKKMIRMLARKDFTKLLTSRNKYLINEEEQRNYQDGNLSIAGLSVGSNIALAVVMQCGCSHIKIADNDEIATSNMNRIVADLFSVGENKAVNLAKKLYEINPFIDVEIFSEGISPENINNFLDKADVVFDEIDSLNLKYDIRIKAKNLNIPLVMITDNGDNIMVDIERYDLDSGQMPFHGLLSEEDLLVIKQSHGKLSPQERVFLSLKIVQPQNAVGRMQESLLEVGKTLKTWPQLATASLLAGSVGSYIVRKILNREPLNSGRLHVSTDSVLIPEFNSDESINERAILSESFLNQVKNMGR